MGTNVVRLTDRKYMTELRQRITEDFQCILMKRINQRKVCAHFIRYHSQFSLNEIVNFTGKKHIHSFIY